MKTNFLTAAFLGLLFSLTSPAQVNARKATDSFKADVAPRGGIENNGSLACEDIVNGSKLMVR